LTKNLLYSEYLSFFGSLSIFTFLPDKTKYLLPFSLIISDFDTSKYRFAATFAKIDKELVFFIKNSRQKYMCSIYIYMALLNFALVRAKD